MSAALSNQIVGDRRAFRCRHQTDSEARSLRMVEVDEQAGDADGSGELETGERGLASGAARDERAGDGIGLVKALCESALRRDGISSNGHAESQRVGKRLAVSVNGEQREECDDPEANTRTKHVEQGFAVHKVFLNSRSVERSSATRRWGQCIGRKGEFSKPAFRPQNIVNGSQESAAQAEEGGV